MKNLKQFFNASWKEAALFLFMVVVSYELILLRTASNNIESHFDTFKQDVSVLVHREMEFCHEIVI